MILYNLKRKMNEENIEKEGTRSMKEFDLAWEEFFKDKQKPTNNNEDKKQQEEFHYWYNYIRKQSDTGKTPAEMYKEIYGEDPKNVFDEKKPSRFMNFEWDDDYEEDFEDEEEISNEEMKNYFDNEIWPRMKRELKDATKKEACFICFVAGSEMMKYSTEKEMEDAREKLSKMSEEEVEAMIRGGIKDKEDNK